MGKLVIFSAPSGSGKTTVAKHLLETPIRICNFRFLLLQEKKRPNEVDGKDYYFLTQEEFESKLANGEFLEYEQVLRRFVLWHIEVRNRKNLGQQQVGNFRC